MFEKLLNKDGELTDNVHCAMNKTFGLLFDMFSVKDSNGTPSMSLFTFLNMINFAWHMNNVIGAVSIFPCDESEGHFEWGDAEYRDKYEFVAFCCKTIDNLHGRRWWLQLLSKFKCNSNLEFDQSVLQRIKDTKPYDLDEFVFYIRDRHIPPKAFQKTTLTTVKLPLGIEEIDKLAFQDCKFLQNVILPRSLEYVHPTAFVGTNCKFDDATLSLFSNKVRIGLCGELDVFEEMCPEELPETSGLFEFDFDNARHLLRLIHPYLEETAICFGTTVCNVYQRPGGKLIAIITSGNNREYLVCRGEPYANQLQQMLENDGVGRLPLGQEFLIGAMRYHGNKALEENPWASSVKVLILVRGSVADEFYRRLIKRLGDSNCIDCKPHDDCELQEGWNLSEVCSKNSFSMNVLSQIKGDVDFVLGGTITRKPDAFSVSCSPGVNCDEPLPKRQKQ